MNEGLIRLYTGDFNYMSQEPQPDGSIVITLSKQGEDKSYRFRVKNLYEVDEEVLEEEIIEIKPLRYILDRMEEAKRLERPSNHRPGEIEETTLPRLPEGNG